MSTINGHMPLSTGEPVTPPAAEHLTDAAIRVIKDRLESEAATALERWLHSSSQSSTTARTELVAAAVQDSWKTHEQARPPLYDDVTQWVGDHFAPIYIRRIQGGMRWCSQWWRHPEAVIRFAALWRTWETARLAVSPYAMADWHLNYLDRMLPVLLGDQGPFYSCKPDAHNDPPPLPMVEPPDKQYV
jgi:hypothetical protein